MIREGRREVKTAKSARVAMETAFPKLPKVPEGK
jgi:hypothetical protein